jgi:hypothetical protein
VFNMTGLLGVGRHLDKSGLYMLSGKAKRKWQFTGALAQASRPGLEAGCEFCPASRKSLDLGGKAASLPAGGKSMTECRT